jgi:hypothetical protein
MGKGQASLEAKRHDSPGNRLGLGKKKRTKKDRRERGARFVRV